MLYLPSSTAPTAAQTDLKMATPGTGTGAPPVAQRLLTIAMPKTSSAHTHTCKQWQTLRNSTTIHKNNKQNYARTKHSMSHRPSRRERILSALEIHRSRTKHSMIMLMG